MWLAAGLAFVAILILLNPKKRANETILAIACAMVFTSTWIDKGLGLIMGGFAITPLEKVATYTPTPPEIMISLGVYGIGALILTVLYKLAVSIKEDPESV
jgi:molybdopterin-containing oxidoreductase family membrane subunit